MDESIQETATIDKQRTVWSYDEIAKIVGNLYLDSHKQISLREEQFQVVHRELTKRVQQLEAENTMLKKLLENKSEQASAVPGFGGQNKMPA